MQQNFVTCVTFFMCAEFSNKQEYFAVQTHAESVMLSLQCVRTLLSLPQVTFCNPLFTLLPRSVIRDP